MSLAQQAIDEADGIIGSLIGLGRDAMRRRRRDAKWWYAYRSRRAAYARTRVGQRWWTFWANKSKAQMEANECCAVDEQLARLPRSGVA